MTNAKVSRRSSSRWDTLFKTDCRRAIDHLISYFGELPASPWTSRPVPAAEDHAQNIDLDRRAVGR